MNAFKLNLIFILFVSSWSLFGNNCSTCDTLFWRNMKPRQIECRGSKTYSISDYKLTFDSFGNNTEIWEYSKYQGYRLISFKKNHVQLVKYGNGVYETYYNNGQNQSFGKIKDGEKKDTWLFFYPNGKLSHKIVYNNLQNIYCCNLSGIINGELIYAIDSNNNIVFQNGKGHFSTFSDSGFIEQTIFISKNVVDSIYRFKQNELKSVSILNKKYNYFELIRSYYENSSLEYEQIKSNDTLYSRTFFRSGKIEILKVAIDSMIHFKTYYENEHVKLDYLYIDCTKNVQSDNDFGLDVCEKEIYRKEWDEHGMEIK